MRIVPHLLVLTLLLAACGGGGGGNGGGSAASDPVDPPAEPSAPATFSLSGTVTTADSQTIDGDTNDPVRVPVSNDTPASAQPISNPVTVGGYINRPRTGAEGRSQLSGDVDDFYRVDLLAGQRITMVVADSSPVNDADLFLFDTRGEVVDFSVASDEIESILVPEDGTYLVNVFAFLGATNYILAIGATNEPARQDYDIVPWQAVVDYSEDTADESGDRDLARRWGLEQRAGGRGRGRLMALRRSLVNADQRQRRIGGAAEKAAAIQDPDLRARWETLMTVKSLRREPGVRTARPNYRVFTQATPNDTGFQYQWHYPLIGLPEAWDSTTGDPSVVVAVIDTGILPGHPDLSGQLVDGYDFIRDPDNALDGNGIDPDPRDPGSSIGGGAEGFHGTHVSGTVAARGNNNLGVTGTAYGARVMPLRALGAGGAGTTYDIEQAVRFAAGLPNDSGTIPARPADIINLSLGGAPFDQATQNLFNDVRARGVLVVAAAGNNASSTPLYPAAYSGVISVSAVDAQRRLAAYSNTGSTIDVAAPGGDRGVDLNGDGFPDGVLSTTGEVLADNSINYVYGFLDGTSFAAPHVAGVLALMKSVNPALTPADIDTLLASGALSDDLGAPGRDDLYGHGLINARRAVLAALEATGSSPAENPLLVASASTLNFGATNTALALTLTNGGSGELGLLDVRTTQPWLQIAPADVDGDGFGEYTVTVDRGSLAPGIYSADINAQSSVNNLSVRVLVSQGLTDAGTGLAVIYILLYDPLLEAAPFQLTAGGNGTEYPFRFTGIPAGEYEIVAGTDSDNDFFICDAGEACGALLTIDQPISLRVEDDIEGLDFPVEYVVSLPTTASRESRDTGIRRPD